MGVTIGDMVVGIARELANLHGDVVGLRNALNAPAGGQIMPVEKSPTPPILPPPTTFKASPEPPLPPSIDLNAVIIHIETAIQRINANAIHSAGGALEHLMSAIDKLTGKGGT